MSTVYIDDSGSITCFKSKSLTQIEWYVFDYFMDNVYKLCAG